jgi:hypothetical protein
MIDALRSMLIVHTPVYTLSFDFAILVVASSIVVAIGGALYSRVIT